MTKQDTNAAAQHAEPAQVQEPINLSELTTIDTTEYEKDEDGAFMNRPNLNVCATLSHESEDYIRIVKTLWEMLPVYHKALKGTYLNAEKAGERYRAVLPLFQQLRDEIAHDMGVCMAERLGEWKEDYI